MKSPGKLFRVDLDNYRHPEGRVFAGRDRGRRARQRAKLDQHDRHRHRVTVHVPVDTFSVTSSFFLAMFGPSIRHHKESLFRKLYTFTGWDATEVVNHGIREALDRSSPL
jgi:hypothetical protein